MSERSDIQDKLVRFLENHANSFTAPYGIIAGMDNVGKGKVRVITFGVARYLDASIEIWSPNKIKIRGQGGLAYKVEGNYSNVDEAIAALKTLVYDKS